MFLRRPRYTHDHFHCRRKVTPRSEDPGKDCGPKSNFAHNRRRLCPSTGISGISAIRKGRGIVRIPFQLLPQWTCQLGIALKFIQVQPGNTIDFQASGVSIPFGGDWDDQGVESRFFCFVVESNANRFRSHKEGLNVVSVTWIAIVLQGDRTHVVRAVFVGDRDRCCCTVQGRFRKRIRRMPYRNRLKRPGD